MADGSGPGLPTLAALVGVSVLAVVGIYASDVVPRRAGGPMTVTWPSWQPGSVPEQARLAPPAYDRSGAPPPEPSAPDDARGGPPDQAQQQQYPGAGQPPPVGDAQRGQQESGAYPQAPPNAQPMPNGTPTAPGDGQPRQ